MSKRPHRPEPLALRKHLAKATVEELEEFLRFWSPHEKRRNGRAKLEDNLLRLMSDENVVYAKVDLLSDTIRGTLAALLRANHFTSDLAGLLRGIDGLEMESYEAEAALTALARRGFVRVSRQPDWLPYGSSAYAVPREMALALRGLAGTDRRPFWQVFLASEYEPAAGDPRDGAERPEVPGDVRAVVAALAEPYRTVAEVVLDDYGGIITRREFLAEFGERGIAWRSAAFLEEFGSARLGTVAHIDLRAKAIGVDDDALVFFLEAVEAWMDGAPAPAHDAVLRARGALMSDVRTTLETVRDTKVKVAKSGSVYKASRARLADRLGFPDTALVERTDVAERALAIARGLQLVRTNTNRRLELTEKGAEWMRRPLLAKVKDAYELLFSAEVQTLRSIHLRGMHALLETLLAGELPAAATGAGDGDASGSAGGFHPSRALAYRARNRYLLDLAREEAQPNRTPLAVRDGALTELGRAAHDVVCRDLFALGLVDVAVHEDRPVAARLSALGRRLLRGEEPEDGVCPLVVNPDFEILALPEGGIDDVLHELDRIAVRDPTSREVAHYRLDRDRLERATARDDDEKAEAWIDFLRRHARTELPQNVVYSMRAWGAGVQTAEARRGVLLQVSDAAVAGEIASHARLKEHVLEVVGETTLFLSDAVTDGELKRELEALGVFVK